MLIRTRLDLLGERNDECQIAYTAVFFFSQCIVGIVAFSTTVQN